jgi:hypothetical protein
MVQIKGEYVQCSDLACSAHHNAPEWHQVPEIPAPGGVGVVRVFIHHASGLLTMPLASLLLEGHVN